MRLALACSFVASISLAQTYAPPIQPASDEPQQVMQTFEKPAGFDVSCFAAEPLFAQPVSFWIARDGGVYVTESFRHHKGVTDIRDHMDWLDDDVAAKTVADRVAMYRKHLGDQFPTYEQHHERVTLLRDLDGDGKADKSTVFADGFKDAADGIAAGVLEYEGSVYFTNIPTLWLLRDRDGDDRAEHRERLSTGWGVRVALLGHDMHGLQVGPDGKIYFSIGDRGFDVTTKEGVHFEHAHTGAVLRMEPDGSQLEIFATGLRNPQELAFDDRGDLWTGDNNSDGGDQARWVFVVEGGETGWRQDYQWLGEPNVRGPWNDERLWIPHFDGQAAYLVPPIANVANGPSGLAWYPGTGLPERYADHFFLCNFSGAADWSGVYTFKVADLGAGFTVGPVERFVWKPLATDCDFGNDGGLYVSDWVSGWNQTGKGRIWRFSEPATNASAVVTSTKALLMGGVAKASTKELAALLAHPDRRVRQDAHLRLARAGDAGFAELVRVAKDRAQPERARWHAIWALGITAAHGDRQRSGAKLVELANEPDAEVRVQALRALADPKTWGDVQPFLPHVDDPSPRAALHALIAIARRGHPRGIEPALAKLRTVGESDPWLRHAATFALWSCASAEQLVALAQDPSVDVRVAATVGLRRKKSPSIATILADAEPRVAAEAARAIYDVPIAESLPALAALIDAPNLLALDVRVPTSKEENAFRAGNGLIRRVLAANWRLGGVERARALARFAANVRASDAARAEALALLRQWKTPPGRDPFHGMWWPIAERDAAFLPEIVAELEPALAAADVAHDAATGANVAITTPSNGRASAVAETPTNGSASTSTSGAHGAAPDTKTESASDGTKTASTKATVVSGSTTTGVNAPPRTPDLVWKNWIELARSSDAKAASPRVTALALDVQRDAKLRATALRALGTLKPDGALETLKQTLFDASQDVRAASISAFQAISPAEAVPLLEKALDGALAERRVAYTGLASLSDPRIDALFTRELTELDRGLVPAEVALDLVVAAEKRGSEALKPALAARGEARKLDEKAAPWIDALYGGDADRGRAIFRGKSETECLRCHAAEEGDAGVVGPKITGLGTRLSRLEILHAIVDPNRTFSPGFQGSVVFRDAGAPVEGAVVQETEALVRVRQADGKEVEIARDEIESIRPGLSAMPANLAEHLSREEMRDLIEYLSRR